MMIRRRSALDIMSALQLIIHSLVCTSSVFMMPISRLCRFQRSSVGLDGWYPKLGNIVADFTSSGSEPPKDKDRPQDFHNELFP
jgi:hypothetical protein